MQPRLILMVAVMVTALLGCGGEPVPQPAGAIAFRWIGDGPAERLRPHDLYESEEVFRWSFSTPDDLDQWEFHDLLAEPVEGGRLRLQPDGEDPFLERTVKIDASSVDDIALTIAGLHANRVRLSWSGALNRFSKKRSMIVENGQVESDHLKRFLFDLHSHPKWTGRVTGLRLEPVNAPGVSVGLAHLVATQRVPKPDRVANALKSAWRIDFDRESRIVLLAPPGQEHNRRFVVPEGAVLRFGYGIQHGLRMPIRFEVIADRGDGSTKLLFAEELDPWHGVSNHWHDATVSLHAYAGEELTIRFTTQTTGTYEIEHGMPVWSSPEIVGGAVPDLPNIVLVCLDTLRADRLSGYGYPLPTTPNIDAMAENDGILFEEVVATSPWTLPSHVSMFTGLDAARHGVNHYGAAPGSLRMLAEYLRAAGYTTAAITGGGYLRPRFALDQGFERFRYWADENSKAELATGLGEVLAWLDDEHSRPFFLFFHTYETHFPHRRRQPWFDILAGAKLSGLPKTEISMENYGWNGLRAPGDFFVARRPGSAEWQTPLTVDEMRLVGLMYDSAVAYADNAVGQLLDRLEILGLSDNTVVVVTSDHGEALGEDGRAGHSFLEDYNTLVPLILRLPDRLGAGRRIGEQVRLVDLAPTILDAAGLSPPLPSDGVSLLHLVSGEPSRVPEAAWTYAPSSNRGLAMRHGRTRMKYTYNDTAWQQLYGEERLVDLETDPLEQHDLLDDNRRGEFRRQVSDTLVEQQQGIRLLIRNRSVHQLKGRLRGALAAHDRLKRAAPGGAHVRWRNDVPPTFIVPRDEEMILLLDSPDRIRAGINAHTVDDSGSKMHAVSQWFDLDTLTTPVAIELTADGWRRIDDPAAPPETGFLIWWQGDLPTSAITAPEGDDEMLEQLRALGYVQ